MAQSLIIDCYQVLGVARDATAKEINCAYKKLALKYHPDKEQGSNDEFQKVNFTSLSLHIDLYMSSPPLTLLQIQHAVEILRDADSRLKHDEELETHAYRYEQGQSDVFEFPPDYTGWRPYDSPMGEPIYMSRYMYSYGNSVHMDPHSLASFEERVWWENMRTYGDDVLPPEPSPIREQCELDEEVIDTHLQHDEHVWMAAEMGTGQWGQWRSEFAQPASNRKRDERGQQEEPNIREKYYKEEHYGYHYRDCGEPAGEDGYGHGDGHFDKHLDDLTDDYVDEIANGHGHDIYEHSDDHIATDFDEHFDEHFDELVECLDGRHDEDFDEHCYEHFDGYYDEDYGEHYNRGYDEEYDKDSECSDEYPNGDYELELEKIHQQQGCGQAESVHGYTEEEVDLMVFSDYETADQSPAVSHSGLESNSNAGDLDGDDGNSEGKQSTTSTDNGTDATTVFYDARSNQSNLSSPGRKMSTIGSPGISGTSPSSSPRKTDNLSTITSLGLSDQLSTTSSDIKYESSHSSQRNAITFNPTNQHLAPFIPYFESKIHHPSRCYTTEDLETEIKGIVLEAYCGWLESIRLSFSDVNPIPKGSSSNTCAHLGAWEKEFMRFECEVCHRWKPIFMLTCPGCRIRKCIGCKFEDWGKRPREEVLVDNTALTLEKDGVPGFSRWPAAATEISEIRPRM